MRERGPCVYITASRRHGTLYIGVTSDIARREWQHRTGEIPGFSKRHGCKRLVWMEHHSTMESAIQREKRLKRWLRAWKIELIESANPHWHPIDTYSGEPVSEDVMERNRAGGWVDKDGNVVSAFEVGPPVKPEDDGMI